MIKKEFLNLNQSPSSDKNGYQGIWKFWVNGKGGPKVWNQALWCPLWYRFFSKVVVTIPRRFQMIKKEFLNLNESLSCDKNGYQGIWKFWVNGKGGPKVWNQALWSPLWYRFFLTNHFHVIKTAIKAFENFGSTVGGGPMDFKSGPVVPPLVSIFFKRCCNYPETFSNDQKGVSELKRITFMW